MLKRVKKEIMYGRHCETVMVLDVAATNANIKACEDEWQGEVENCKDQISKYTDLKNEIAGKQAEATALQAEMANNASVMATANITHADAVGDVSSCSNCLDELQESYASMSAECDNEIADWTAKQEEAQNNKDGCKSDASLEVYKPEEHCWDD
jgi:chromosome segregation ATPase